MTRPKVQPDKRQRVAQACESCRRRKQKCNGQNPCNTCTKRNFECSYISSDKGNDPKQQNVDQRKLKSDSLTTPVSIAYSPVEGQAPTPPQYGTPSSAKLEASPQDPPSINFTAIQYNFQPASFHRSTQGIIPGASSEGVPRVHIKNDQNEEEDVVHNSTGMLQDPTGRMLYAGDDATLSFLQLTRMIIGDPIGSILQTVQSSPGVAEPDSPFSQLSPYRVDSFPIRATIESPGINLNANSSASIHHDRSEFSRDPSYDAFRELARATNNRSGRSSGDSSIRREPEVDFDQLLQWPINSTGAPDNGLAQAAFIGNAGGMNATRQAHVQGVTNGSIPLFGMPNADFFTDLRDLY